MVQSEVSFQVFGILRQPSLACASASVISRRNSFLTSGLSFGYLLRLSETADRFYPPHSLLLFASLSALRALTRSRGTSRRQPVIMSVTATQHGGAQQKYEAMSDKQILSTLFSSFGLRAQDMGAGGNCLFLSIAPQIQSSDVSELYQQGQEWNDVLGNDLSVRWNSLRNIEKASVLRRIAMLDEVHFFSEVAAYTAKDETLPPYLEIRTREMFADMAEEFISSNKTELAANIPGWNRKALYDRVRDLLKTKTLKEIQQFILAHADEYIRTTGREGNWAGSSEMAALAHALKRDFKAYGNNWVSQDEVRWLEVSPGNWELQPYFEALVDAPQGPPVTVFQTNGGGHYQMLTANR